MSDMSDVSLRSEITKILKDGLNTKIEPVPKSNIGGAHDGHDAPDGTSGDSISRNQITKEIANSKGKPDELKNTLLIAGFLNRPHNPFPEKIDEPQQCLECMHYSVHRKWCSVPEISLPTEDYWWCRLWHI